VRSQRGETQKMPAIVTIAHCGFCSQAEPSTPEGRHDKETASLRIKQAGLLDPGGHRGLTPRPGRIRR
jgi:hypothetical protein